MAGNAMGALTVQVGAESFKLWLGMSVLADVQEEFPDAFDKLIAGTLATPPLKMVHRIVAGALERYHPEKAADRFFVDDVISENDGVFKMLLTAASPPAGAKPGNRKALRTT